MTIWTPLLAPDRPAYLAIADAIALDRKSGRLDIGEKLPPHRELAFQLGLTVGTVTRGYQEAARRGLTRGEVGRGTFVATADPPPLTDAAFVKRQAFDAGMLNLTITRPALSGAAAPTAAALRRLGDIPALEGLLDYGPTEGRVEHRAAIARWLRSRGAPAEPDRIVISSGAQNALALAAAGLLRPGDTVAVDPLTYPGFKSAASLFSLRLLAVPGDADGMRPESLAAAADAGATAVYLMPNLHNPTMATMPLARRHALAETATAHDLLILEDDVYGFLLEGGARPPPIAQLAPERTALIGSVSKFMSPALRVGWLVTPEKTADQAANALRGLAWMASPILTALVAEAIDTGEAAKLAAAQRAEARQRMAVARELLGPWLPETPPDAMHLWLPLPEPWRTDAFVAEAEARRIAITGAGAFAVGRNRAPHAVRLGLGAATLPRLKAGLATLADLLAAPPRAAAGAVV